LNGPAISRIAGMRKSSRRGPTGVVATGFRAAASTQSSSRTLCDVVPQWRQNRLELSHGLYLGRAAERHASVSQVASAKDLRWVRSGQAPGRPVPRGMPGQAIHTGGLDFGAHESDKPAGPSRRCPTACATCRPRSASGERRGGRRPPAVPNTAAGYDHCLTRLVRSTRWWFAAVQARPSTIRARLVSD
jgi:hypothetical protein